MCYSGCRIISTYNTVLHKKREIFRDSRLFGVEQICKSSVFVTKKPEISNDFEDLHSYEQLSNESTGSYLSRWSIHSEKVHKKIYFTVSESEDSKYKIYFEGTFSRDFKKLYQSLRCLMHIFCLTSDVFLKLLMYRCFK